MTRAAAPVLPSRAAWTSSIGRLLPAVLLVAQILLPWCVRRLVTQDGPSHLYTAMIAKDLALHGGALYGAVYHLQPLTNPNWATTVLLAGMSALVGVVHAEQLLMSVCLLGGFLAFSYAARALGACASYSPIANFLVQTWFLWIGYYNFYLGMVLGLWLVGFCLRRASALGWPGALTLGLGGVLLALTHPVPAAITVMAVTALALWSDRPAQRLGATLAALAPALILLLLFAREVHAPAQYRPDTYRSLASFPMQVFATGSGDWGGQRFVWPVVLLTIAAGMLLMRRNEWRGPRGALAAVTCLCFFGYLLLPDRGFGGGEAKIRFAWATLLFGALTVSSVQRLLRWQAPLALFLAVALTANLAATWHTARALSQVAGDYLAAASVIPRGARFVRLRYHTPTIPWRYGFSGNHSDPLLHLDAYVAAAGPSLDLSDWQPANPVFSVGLNHDFSSAQREALWSLESPFPAGSAVLRQLRRSLPSPVEYVILVGEPAPGTDYEGLVTELDATMQLISSSRNQFVRVYRDK